VWCHFLEFTSKKHPQVISVQEGDFFLQKREGERERVIEKEERKRKRREINTNAFDQPRADLH